MSRRLAFAVFLFAFNLSMCRGEELLRIDNGVVRVGIDPGKGGSITWLSWDSYPKNIVNIADAGRLIQQSYYAGARLDRTDEGQWKAWSPWTWNPIQGGGVESWARVKTARLQGDEVYSETIPKLWDMPSEEADAQMNQWTTFEPSMPNVIVVRCELECMRKPSDRWGAARMSSQEIPACYFTRNFDTMKSYLGNGQWRDETHPPGPPWGKALPPLNAMAFFESGGQGIAVYSPAATQHWNFGPHGAGKSDLPTDGPCMHVAPIDRVKLQATSSYRYRYWMTVGDQVEIQSRLDSLIELYSDETTTLSP